MKKSALLCVLLMGCCAAGCGAITQAPQTQGQIPPKDAAQPVAAAVPSTIGQFALFQQAMARVRASYVRPVEDGELIDGAIQGMVSGLDPHSSYLNAKAYSNTLTATTGQFGGVGLVMEPDGGLIKVITAKDGAPAAKAGIKAEDKISAIDGVSVDGMDFNEAIDKLRGAPGHRFGGCGKWAPRRQYRLCPRARVQRKNRRWAGESGARSQKTDRPGLARLCAGPAQQSRRTG
jgi:hypothetical protein